MSTEIARTAHNALEALHAMIYFAPEAETEFVSLGLEKGSMCYFAGRAAPMGAVGPGVVAATFYNFNPNPIAKVIPRAWSIATPEQVVSARFRAADGALRRMLGADTLASPELAECADLAQEATAALSPEGRPLYAGHADLEWPDEPHLRLWHAATLLREFRGDGHIAALRTAGLSGLQALVLNCATGKGLNAESAQFLRRWSDEKWATAKVELCELGLLDADGEMTAEGAELREAIEVSTDTQAIAPWIVLGADKVERLMTLGGAYSATLTKAGAFPRELFSRN